MSVSPSRACGGLEVLTSVRGITAGNDQLLVTFTNGGVDPAATTTRDLPSVDVLVRFGRSATTAIFLSPIVAFEPASVTTCASPRGTSAACSFENLILLYAGRSRGRHLRVGAGLPTSLDGASQVKLGLLFLASSPRGRCVQWLVLRREHGQRRLTVPSCFARSSRLRSRLRRSRRLCQCRIGPRDLRRHSVERHAGSVVRDLDDRFEHRRRCSSVICLSPTCTACSSSAERDHSDFSPTVPEATSGHARTHPRGRRRVRSAASRISSSRSVDASLPDTCASDKLTFKLSTGTTK